MAQEHNQKTIMEEYFNRISFPDLLKTGKTSAEVIEMVNSIEKMMNHYAANITYSQMRNIYGIIKEKPESQMTQVAKLHMARPRIAYIQARQKSADAKKIIAFITDLIKNIDKKEQCVEFENIMETIVAYHKLFGKN